MEFIRKDSIVELANPGVSQPRYTHEASEQIKNETYLDKTYLDRKYL